MIAAKNRFDSGFNPKIQILQLFLLKKQYEVKDNEKSKMLQVIFTLKKHFKAKNKLKIKNRKKIKIFYEQLLKNLLKSYFLNKILISMKKQAKVIGVQIIFI